MRRELIVISAALCLLSGCKSETPMSVRMVDSQIHRCPEATYLDYTPGKLKWNYTPGLELRSFLDVYEAYGDEAIYDYVHEWYDSIVNEDGSIQTRAYLRPIFEGKLDYDAYIRALAKAGTSYMLVEQDWCYDEGPFECLRRSYEHVTKRFPETK